MAHVRRILKLSSGSLKVPYMGHYYLTYFYTTSYNKILQDLEKETISLFR